MDSVGERMNMDWCSGQGTWGQYLTLIFYIAIPEIFHDQGHWKGMLMFEW